MQIDEIITKILVNSGFSDSDTASDRGNKIYVRDLFRALIASPDRRTTAQNLNITKSKLEYILSTRISPKIHKAKQEHWNIKLLELAGYRRCTICSEIKLLEEFTSCKTKTKGIVGRCKPCGAKLTSLFRENNPEYPAEYRKANVEQHREYCASYRATKLQAMPMWADKDKIKEVYLKCPDGMHVDHIIPLRGEFVCGLHVHNNLQYLMPAENLQKSNKYT